jgi:hypothetical protein
MELDFWDSSSQDGPVATVNPGDLQKVWAICHRRNIRTPNQQFAIGFNAFKVVCSSGADVHAVWCRASLLELMCGRMGLLSRWLHSGELDDAVFKVAATFPIKKLQVGVVHQGLPLDVKEFLKQIEELPKP